MNSRILRWLIAIAAVIFSIYALSPTFYDAFDGALDGDFQDYDDPISQYIIENGTPLTLGLDLQGGLLLQYHVMVDKALQDKLDRITSDLRKDFSETYPNMGVDVSHKTGDDFILVSFTNPSDASEVNAETLNRIANMQRTNVESGFKLSFDNNYLDTTKEGLITQAIETIRERIDALGVTEPSINRRGDSDIVVQLPGLKEDDVDRAKNLIGQTAQLKFRMVDDDGTNAFFDGFSGKLPAGFQLRAIDGNQYRSVTHKDLDTLKAYLNDKVDENHIIGYQFHPVYSNLEERTIDKDRSYWKSYYIFREVNLTGDNIQEAHVAVDPRFNRPYVALNFDRRGAVLFGELSGANVNKRMAIMLDDTVRSAPVFNEKILGGRAQITLGSNQSYAELAREAEDLVIALQHGALPAPIEKQFETVVGPTLGQDAIQASTFALTFSLILIALFITFYYRASGLIAVVGLLLNMLFVTAALGFLGATLTLPGFAGLVLTIGMAIDANVIIFERIREELKAGKTPYFAVKNGFDAALSAVLDSNITNGIAGLVLLETGIGPIRGFAVTLLIGVVSTIFTTTFICRLLFDTFVTKDTKSLSI